MNTTCILQVEDDANDVFLLQRAFREVALTNPVRVVTDGQMAIDYLAGVGRFSDRNEFPLPGLVLLDLKLPHRSGREVLQWIRTQPSLRRVIVMVFTAGQYVGDVGLAYDLGANAFLLKPQDFSQYVGIARLLKDWLRHNLFAPILETAWPAAFQPADAPRLWSNPS
ncbi:MAG TPA: response regulator [Verrucomicrobiae bacterium]|nr:response regulator [Verrucomicrobiae bacterium]